MVIPRLGAVFLLVAYGFAASQVGRLMYVTAREGYSSWTAVAALVGPVGALGFASALLVLWRKPLGARLVLPFCALLVVTAAITFLGTPPVGAFLDDYERAAVARGVDVPPYLEARGTTALEYVSDETDQVRTQGAIGALVAVVVYGATVLRGTRSSARPRQARARA